MSQAPMPGSRVLVLVSPDGSPVQTVEYAVRDARDTHAEFAEPVVVDVRIVVSAAESSAGTETKNRLANAVSRLDAAAEVDTRIEILDLAGDSTRRTAALYASLEDHDFSRLILDPTSEFSVEELREQFGMGNIELAPTASPERRRLLHPAGVRRIGTIFGLTYLFYLAIGGFAGGFEYVTGAISAGVAALSLSHVALRDEPALVRTGQRLGRMACFLPVLLWEIVKANFVIAAIILHPRLPIDPSVDTVETDTREGLERMVLANSITLTPGTLTIDVREREFIIHALTPAALRDVEGGRLARLVAWVFYGRQGGPNSGGDSR